MRTLAGGVVVVLVLVLVLVYVWVLALVLVLVHTVTRAPEACALWQEWW